LGELQSITSAQEIAASRLPREAAPRPVLKITPPSRWFELRLGELWAYRELLYFFVWRDVKVRYKQTVIGIAWVILQPLLTMVVFTLIFGRLAKMPSEGLPHSVFYFAATLPWAYFSSALQNATNIVVENQRVITKVYFPRLALPVSAVLSGLVDFAIGFVVLISLLLGYGIRPGLAALWLPALLLLAILTALGVGLWLSALNALYRDVRYVVPFLVNFWMLASPVIYPSTILPQRWQWLYGLNPMAGVIEGFRWALTGHGQPPGALLLASSAMVIVVLLAGWLFFQRMESTVADLV
jgi:lipopolysaccharide transport system permease protein